MFSDRSLHHYILSDALGNCLNQCRTSCHNWSSSETLLSAPHWPTLLSLQGGQDCTLPLRLHFHQGRCWPPDPWPRAPLHRGSGDACRHGKGGEGGAESSERLCGKKPRCWTVVSEQQRRTSSQQAENELSLFQINQICGGRNKTSQILVWKKLPTFLVLPINKKLVFHPSGSLTCFIFVVHLSNISRLWVWKGNEGWVTTQPLWAAGNPKTMRLNAWKETSSHSFINSSLWNTGTGLFLQFLLLTTPLNEHFTSKTPKLQNLLRKIMKKSWMDGF